VGKNTQQKTATGITREFSSGGVVYKPSGADKKEGDKVEKGEILLEITTDKATLEVKIKGDTRESSVWSAGYWLRLFKKAVYFGWKVLFDGKVNIKQQI